MKQPRPPSLFVRSQAKRGPFLKQDQVAATSKQKKNKKKLIIVFVYVCVYSIELNRLLLAGDLEFEAPLKIVEYPDPILRAKNKRIDSFDDNLKKLVDEMFDVMYK